MVQISAPTQPSSVHPNSRFSTRIAPRLDILVHPLTDDALAEHTWHGQEVALAVDVFKREADRPVGSGSSGAPQ